MLDYQENYAPDGKCKDCDAVVKQHTNVAVPVAIKPEVHTGPVKVSCFGKPVIIPTPCTGGGKGCDSCCYVISQRISIEIPVKFDADVFIGDPSIDCSVPD